MRLLFVFTFFSFSLFLPSFSGYNNTQENDITDSFFIRSNKTDSTISLPTKIIKKHSNFTLLDKNETLASGQDITLLTPSKLKIPATFFDRKSNKVIVLGQGFPGPRKCTLYFARVFHDYDIIVFDYRWHTMLDNWYDLITYIFSFSTLTSPATNFVYAVHEEIATVVNYLKSLKNYDSIIGLGECYSTLTFPMAQNIERKKNNRQLFSKLILDSCWLSLLDLNKQILLEPWLIADHSKQATPKCLKAFLQHPLVHTPIMSIARAITPDLTIKPYLNHIQNTPILFVHSTKDSLVPYKNTFEEIWQATRKTSKASFITQYPHVKNAKNPGLYYHVCNLFCTEKTIDSFLQKLPSDTLNHDA